MNNLLTNQIVECVRCETTVKEFYALVLISRLVETYPFFVHEYRGPQEKRRQKSRVRAFVSVNTVRALQDRFLAVIERQSRSSLNLPTYRPDQQQVNGIHSAGPRSPVLTHPILLTIFEPNITKQGGKTLIDTSCVSQQDVQIV